MNEDKLHPAVEKILNSSMNSPTLGKPEKMKHEEIKHMAWEIYFQQVKLDYDPPITLTHIFNSSWEIAEEFYNRAKEKEEENKR